ncbi:hypothetical protein E2P71_04790 [Candidatus Bathyarchaeota archaeon]|nr:hypothetical protein E2P71_04790 [Candidatus Bathyarchaeota archaeon]
MSAKNNKITWITCPDCGAKIGVVLSVGKVAVPPTVTAAEPQEAEAEWPPQQDFKAKLEAAGVDIALVDVEESGDMISVSPKKFLGDLWGPINDAIKTLGGNWVRDGRNSRWEISLGTEG